MNGLGCSSPCQGLQTWSQGLHHDAAFGLPPIDVRAQSAQGEAREGFLAFADRILNDKRTWYFSIGFILGVKLCRRFQ